MPTPACKQAALSCARQVYSLQDFFQPRLEEPVVFAQAPGRGLPRYCASPSPSQGLPSSLMFPQKRGRSSPHPGEVSQGAARWEKPPLHPRSSRLLLAARVAFPSLSSVPSGEDPAAQGGLWARGFPTEEPEQFGKAVTSLWPGENGM